MALALKERLAELVAAYPQLGEVSQEQLIEAACRSSASVWASIKRGFVNAAFQEEWYVLAATARRLALLAPREHAKSEIFSVNTVAHQAIYRPGTWTYIFCNSGDQGEKILSRVTAAVAETEPDLIADHKVLHVKEVVLANDSKVTVRGSGAAVRGAHPDLIVGDDVQDENNTMNIMQRERLKNWWFGTVGGMTHPGTTRVVRPLHGEAYRVDFPATRILLVGTPFHALDLLMSCRENSMYTWRLYPAVRDAGERQTA